MARMNIARVAAIVAVVLLFITGAIAYWFSGTVTLKRPLIRGVSSEAQTPRLERPKKIVLLYFLDPAQNILQEETREIVAGATTVEDAKRTLEELVKGPESDLKPTVPPAARIRNLFVDSFGTAYADFDRELKVGHPGSPQAELFTVFSIVDTLAANYPQIRRVQILLEEAEIPTLMGHVDTRAPLTPRFTF